VKLAVIQKSIPTITAPTNKITAKTISLIVSPLYLNVNVGSPHQNPRFIAGQNASKHKNRIIPKNQKLLDEKYGFYSTITDDNSKNICET
jgi:hypothetical protein